MHQVFNENIKYYIFDIFPENDVIQAIFTRNGGISPAPWASLNQGGTTGDIRSRVVDNRRLAFNSVKLEVGSIFDVWQVHGTRIIYTNKPRNLDQPHEKADVIATDKPGISMFMRFADCVPILMFDPKNRVIAITHAGWQGTVKRIAGITVKYLVQNFRCKPEEILAGIGPSIGPDHYIIQKDVVDRVEKSFKGKSHLILHNSEGNTYLNLWEANRICLNEAGVQKIESSDLCTACNLDDWYSHRAENGRTGRFGVIFALK